MLSVKEKTNGQCIFLGDDGLDLRGGGEYR